MAVLMTLPMPRARLCEIAVVNRGKMMRVRADTHECVQ